MLKGKDAALLAELSFLGSEGLQEAEGLCLEQGLTTGKVLVIRVSEERERE